MFLIIAASGVGALRLLKEYETQISALLPPTDPALFFLGIVLLLFSVVFFLTFISFPGAIVLKLLGFKKRDVMNMMFEVRSNSRYLRWWDEWMIEWLNYLYGNS